MMFVFAFEAAMSVRLASISIAFWSGWVMKGVATYRLRYHSA
jgi:hypothetical protein